MKDRAFWVAILATAVLAMIGCLPLFDLIDSEAPLLLSFPGVIASLIVGGNVHTPNPALAFLFTWVFWMLAFLGARKIWSRFHA